MSDNDVVKWWVTRIFGVVFVVWIGTLVIGPPYHVWQQKLVGEAELRRAEQNKKILIEQAEAEAQAATHRAKAIEIVGDAAKKYPEYRQQEFIGAFGEALKNENIGTMIFVPTEANIPITEAGRTANRYKPK